MLGALASKVGFSNGRAFDVDKELPDLTGKVRRPSLDKSTQGQADHHPPATKGRRRHWRE